MNVMHSKTKKPEDVAFVIGWCEECNETYIADRVVEVEAWTNRHTFNFKPHSMAVRIVYQGCMHELVVALSFGIRNWHPRCAR